MDEKNLYNLIYRYLLARIYYGFYPKDEYLPSIHKLSSLFGISTMAVRNALKLLEQDGYIYTESNRRSVVLYDKEKEKKKIPGIIMLTEADIQYMYQSFALIFSYIYYYGFAMSSPRDIQDMYQILNRPSVSWDEPVIAYLASLVKKMRNPLLLSLYYDVILFCYPSYLGVLAGNPEHWEDSYKKMNEKLYHILQFKEKNEDEKLWDMLQHIQPDFQVDNDPSSISQNTIDYHWGKPRPGLSAANEIVSRIFDGQYPVNSFLPSARLLSEEFSIAPITMRRSIALLNDLGVTDSINGKGTRVLSPEEGREKIKWGDPAVRKNIMLYLQALQILALTCRPLTVNAFSLVSPQKRRRTIEEIKQREQMGYTGAANVLCVKTLVSVLNLPALKDIFDKLLSFLIWGQPLSYLKPTVPVDSFTRQLISGLESENAALFCSALEQTIAATFLTSKAKAVSMGIEEANTLPLPEGLGVVPDTI